MRDENTKDKRVDGSSRDRIDEIGRNYNRFARLVLVLFYIQVASLFGFGIVSLYLGNENHKRSDENAKLLIRVQAERKNAIIRGCQDQNDRNTRTKEKLDNIADKRIAKEPKKEPTIRASVESTNLLIDTLAPKRNCLQLANQSVKAQTNP